ncbi:MAG: Rrf2 family transcriptional regulator [Bacteroidales bacterium]|nr:Rrf2 family transcriptional regulator [Bacteroidales bacterium]
MFSKACEYGIKASVYIIDSSLKNQKVSMKDVAKAIDSPESYTSKILQQLARNNIIKSEKGPTGGFSIEKDKINQLNLSMIVFAIDGDSIYNECGLGFHKCNESKPCVIHRQYKTIRGDLKMMLENTLLVDLSDDIEKGLSFLRR